MEIKQLPTTIPSPATGVTEAPISTNRLEQKEE